jgi:hypothetical protein
MTVTNFLDQTVQSADFNAHQFVIKMMMARMSTATLVQVQSCTNSGGLSVVGSVNVLPLVNMIDGANVATPHQTVFQLPYCRVQGGTNAVIIDPAIGDIGIAIFADRDISSVIANKGQANPGSARRFDMSDGLYIGGFLNSAPSQFIQFQSSGITITSPSAVTINSPTVTVNATTSMTINSPTVTVNATTSMTITSPLVTIDGNIVTTGTITNNGLDISSTHMHPGVTSGSSDTGPPL